MRLKKSDLSPYQKRIQSALKRGLSLSQARGHSRIGEVPAKLLSLAKQEPRTHSTLLRAIQLNNPDVIESVKRAYKATGNVEDIMNPLMEKASSLVREVAAGGIVPSVKGVGRMRGLASSRQDLTVHVAVDKGKSQLSTNTKYKVFTSDGVSKGSDLSLDEALELAEEWDEDYDLETDEYFNGDKEDLNLKPTIHIRTERYIKGKKKWLPRFEVFNSNFYVLKNNLTKQAAIKFAKKLDPSYNIKEDPYYDGP